MCRRMRVATHQRDTRSNEALLRSDHVDNAVPCIADTEMSELEFDGVVGKKLDLRTCLFVRYAPSSLGRRVGIA